MERGLWLVNYVLLKYYKELRSHFAAINIRFIRM